MRTHRAEISRIDNDTDILVFICNLAQNFGRAVCRSIVTKDMPDAIAGKLSFGYILHRLIAFENSSLFIKARGNDTNSFFHCLVPKLLRTIESVQCKLFVITYITTSSKVAHQIVDHDDASVIWDDDKSEMPCLRNIVGTVN